MANLIEYLPDILRDFYEYQELFKTQNPEFDTIDDLLLKWRDNLFPKTADEDGIKFFEEMLNIEPIPDDTLDIRRYRVLAKLNSRLPYTEIQLRKMLAAICGWDGFTLTVADLVVLVSLTEQSGDKVRVIYEMLRETIPMNLLIEIHQLLNSYGVLYSAATTRWGSTLTILPWQNKSLESNITVSSGGAMRLGTTLMLYPNSGQEINGIIRIAAPGVIRTGTRMQTGV